MTLRLDYTNMLAENVPGGVPLASLESAGDTFARAMAVFDERRGRGELGFLDLPSARQSTQQIRQFAEGAGQAFSDIVVLGIIDRRFGAPDLVARDPGATTVTTPLLYFATAHWRLDGGANITGSHNPVDYNGVKMVHPGAAPLSEDETERLIAALLERDGEKARRVIAGDRVIDSMEVEIEEQCINLLALQQPMARDLRMLTSALKIANDLERVGDHAVNIAQSAERLNQARPIAPEPEIIEMARLARDMLSDALEAFIRGDAAAGREVCLRDDKVDALHRSVFRILLTHMMADAKTINPSLEYLLVSRNLERIVRWLRDPVTWKSLVFVALKFPLGIVSFAAVAFSGFISLVFLFAPLIVLITPLLPDFATMDFHRAKEAIGEGRAAVERMGPLLQQVLG